MEYKIRKAGVEDLESVQNLSAKLCVDENRKFNPTAIPDFYLTDKGKEGLRRCIAGDFSAIFVAEIDGKIIGYLAGGVQEAEKCRNIKYLCELGSLWVDDEYRSKGIGKELVKEFEKWCREKKVSRLSVDTSAGNERAIEFYRKEGFEDYELILEKPLN